MNPTMREVKILHKLHILTISKDPNGMNNRIVTNNEVEDGW